MFKVFCPYCGKQIDRGIEAGWFTHGGVIFHGTCRKEALENAKKKCQDEIKESLKWRKKS